MATDQLIERNFFYFLFFIFYFLFLKIAVKLLIG